MSRKSRKFAVAIGLLACAFLWQNCAPTSGSKLNESNLNNNNSGSQVASGKGWFWGDNRSHIKRSGVFTFDPSENTTVDQKRNEDLVYFKNKGMHIIPVYIDWLDIEPTPGQLNLTGVQASLSYIKSLGYKPFVNLIAVDGDNLSVPTDLSDPSNRNKFKAPYNWSHSEVKRRYQLALAQLIPKVLDADGFYIGFGNEAHYWLESNPNAISQFVDFVTSSRMYVDSTVASLAPTQEIKSAVTINAEALLRTHSPDLTGLISAGSAMVLNYYCPMQSDSNSYKVYSLEDTKKKLDEEWKILNAKAKLPSGKPMPILLQEVGCNSGYRPGRGQAAKMGASEDYQAQGLEMLFAKFHSNPQIRMINFFKHSDFPESQCNAFRDTFFPPPVPAQNQELVERFRETVCSYGLRWNDTGEKKKAWSTFDKWVTCWGQGLQGC